MAASIRDIVAPETRPNGGNLTRDFSRVVTWSHLAHEARSNPPSPDRKATRRENLRCSIEVIGTTQMSNAWRLSASVEITKAGRSLSSRTRHMSPRRGNQPDGAGLGTWINPSLLSAATPFETSALHVCPGSLNRTKRLRAPIHPAAPIRERGPVVRLLAHS